MGCASSRPSSDPPKKEPLPELDASRYTVGQRVLLQPGYCRNASDHHPETKLPFKVILREETHKEMDPTGNWIETKRSVNKIPNTCQYCSMTLGAVMESVQQNPVGGKAVGLGALSAAGF